MKLNISLNFIYKTEKYYGKAQTVPLQIDLQFCYSHVAKYYFSCQHPFMYNQQLRYITLTNYNKLESDTCLSTGGICMYKLWMCEIQSHHFDYMSPVSRKPVFGFPTRSDINRPVQSKKKARSLKFEI